MTPEAEPTPRDFSTGPCSRPNELDAMTPTIPCGLPGTYTAVYDECSLRSGAKNPGRLNAKGVTATANPPRGETPGAVVGIPSGKPGHGR